MFIYLIVNIIRSFAANYKKYIHIKIYFVKGVSFFFVILFVFNLLEVKLGKWKLVLRYCFNEHLWWALGPWLTSYMCCFLYSKSPCFTRLWTYNIVMFALMEILFVVWVYVYMNK